MPKYLIEAAYSVEGLRGLQNDSGTGRRDAIANAFKSAGGSVECVYFVFGDRDVIVVVDLPDNVAAAALAITGSASGLVRIKVTPLLTAEEIDAALKKSVSFRPPGR
jgi:uncharacterized protein with GYD domain